MESSKAKNPRERERVERRRRRRRRRWDKKAYHRWRRHADHNKLQGWWCKKQEEEKRNMFGKPFQQQPYHVLLSLMFCCISLLSQSFLSLSYICMSMCQSNPSLSVSWHDAKKQPAYRIDCLTQNLTIFLLQNPSGALHLCPEPGRVLDWTFLPSLEPRRISNAQNIRILLSWKNLILFLNVVNLYKCKVYRSL